MTVTLRPATPADAPAFHAVMMAAGMDPRSSWNRVTVPDLERTLAAGGGFLGLDGSEAVGCVAWRPDPAGQGTLTLSSLATLPSARGRGIGRALVRAVEERAVQSGYHRVLLAVSAYNQEVTPFYQRLGYAASRDRYAFASPHSPAPLVMVREIPYV